LNAKTNTNRRLSPEDREQQILEGAVKFFAEKGFSGQTRELALQLGITQPLLYRYFPTKRSLIERVFEEAYINKLDPEWSVALLTAASHCIKDYVPFTVTILKLPIAMSGFVSICSPLSWKNP